MAIKHSTYQTYLDSIQHGSTTALKEKSRTLNEHFRSSKQIPVHFAPVTFLVDFATKKYIHVGETSLSVTGYTSKWFSENSLLDYLNKWYPADFAIINQKVFPDNLAFLKTLHADQFSDYIFSYNYRLQNPRDEYVKLLQRCTYIASPEKSEPLGMIGVAFDITHFKNDSAIIHTIEKVIKDGDGAVNELVFKKIYPVPDLIEGRRQVLSKRELEILKSISCGLSSKQIAHDMRLSVNTVNNHRRNMLARTNCKSSAELMNYAVKHGFLLNENGV
jgi:DNA-binding CsgD family transcriptional regulator